MYPSGHNFGNQFVQVKGDKCTVGRIPIHNKLVYWFVTQKVMYGRGGKFLILLYNTKSITTGIPSTPAYYDFGICIAHRVNIIFHISRQNVLTCKLVVFGSNSHDTFIVCVCEKPSLPYNLGYHLYNKFFLKKTSSFL